MNGMDDYVQWDFQSHVTYTAIVVAPWSALPLWFLVFEPLADIGRLSTSSSR
jgi:hypothetical protein